MQRAESQLLGTGRVRRPDPTRDFPSFHLLLLTSQFNHISQKSQILQTNRRRRIEISHWVYNITRLTSISSHLISSLRRLRSIHTNATTTPHNAAKTPSSSLQKSNLVSSVTHLRGTLLHHQKHPHCPSTHISYPPSPSPTPHPSY
jgi:hypothetical protein